MIYKMGFPIISLVYNGGLSGKGKGALQCESKQAVLCFVPLFLAHSLLAVEVIQHRNL